MEHQRLRGYLERGLGRPVQLTLTNNRTRYVTFARNRDGYRIRAQQVFARAPEPVLQDLVAIVRGDDPLAERRITAYFEEARGILSPGQPLDVHPAGRTYDLAPLFDDLNERWFAGGVTALVTWGAHGKGRRRARRRTIILGSYDPERSLIRLNPILDAMDVPERFVRYILFHEMLHADLGIVHTADGRRCIHGEEFRWRERSYPDYAYAVAWERKNLRRLLAKRG